MADTLQGVGNGTAADGEGDTEPQRAFEASRAEVRSLFGKSAKRIAATGDKGAAQMRKLADAMEPDSQWLGDMMRRSAESLERMADHMRDGELRDAARALGAYARREPAIFLGGCLAVGYLFGRLGRAALTNNTNFDADTPILEEIADAE